MLSLLHIENIAVIEQAEILLEPGFSVLTGETGAGKSIVIDAISAILGHRAYPTTRTSCTSPARFWRTARTSARSTASRSRWRCCTSWACG